MRLKSLLAAAVISVASIAAAQPSQGLRPQAEPVSHEVKLVQNDQLQRRVALVYFWAWYGDQLRIAQAELNRRAEAHRQEVRQRHTVSSVAQPPDRGAVGPVYGSGRCGGDLPSCYVMNRESGGNIRAENPKSTASGKWQILDSTWNGFMGYSHAADAPEWVQDAKARTMAACNWEPPNYCAG